MKYRYYSIRRPLGPGTIPNSREAKLVENFDDVVFCEEIARTAWGFVEYEYPLEKDMADRYELVPGKTFWLAKVSRMNNGKVVAKVMGMENAFSKPEDVTRQLRNGEMSDVWFESREEAQKFVDDALKDSDRKAS